MLYKAHQLSRSLDDILRLDAGGSILSPQGTFLYLDRNFLVSDIYDCPKKLMQSLQNNLTHLYPVRKLRMMSRRQKPSESTKMTPF